MEHSSVVIVGGGIIGTSIAFHLAEGGVEDVLLIERAELGSGSTAKGAGGIRAMFSDELNVSSASSARRVRGRGPSASWPGSSWPLRPSGAASPTPGRCRPRESHP